MPSAARRSRCGVRMLGLPVAAEVAPAQVVGKYENNIRYTAFLGTYAYVSRVY